MQFVGILGVHLHLGQDDGREEFSTDPSKLPDAPDGTGLSKSSAQHAIRLLKRRGLLTSWNRTATGTPEYRIERSWKKRGN